MFDSFGHGFLGVRPERAFQRQARFSCIGVVMFLGTLMLVVAPDPAMPVLHMPAATARSVIVLDAGHGGHDNGARARNGLYEKNLALDITSRVGRMLKANDYSVVMTRDSDKFLRLSQRAQVGNATDNALFVSIHLNDSRASQASGVETYYSDWKEPPTPDWAWLGYFARQPPLPDQVSQELAQRVQTTLVNHVEGSDRGIHKQAFYVVRNVRRPAILVECGFVSNPLEAQLFTNMAYRERVAEGITEGIMAYDQDRMIEQKTPALVKK